MQRMSEIQKDIKKYLTRELGNYKEIKGTKRIDTNGDYHAIWYRLDNPTYQFPVIIDTEGNTQIENRKSDSEYWKDIVYARIV